MKQPKDLGTFTTSSGRHVSFEALHIEVSTLGWLEGDLLIHRERFLERLPKTIERKFGRTGMLLVEPPPGPLPTYVFNAQFHSEEPVHKGADCSSLTLVWFTETMPADLRSELQSRFSDIDWESHAEDGIY